MKLDKKYKIEKVVGDDWTRDKIRCPFISKVDEKDVLIATNGKVMAVVPVELDNGETGKVSVDEIVAQRKGIVAVFPRPEGELLENPTRVIPPKDEKVLSVCLDIKMLKDLADALGTNTLRLQITGPLDAVRVENGMSYGAIMPVRMP